jgi:membrane protein implicated in regulation of membrane protease activity
MAANYLRGNVVPTNADKLIGKTAHLTKEITSEAWGELVISGMTWSCISIDGEPIRKDAKVKIMAIEGVKLIVKSIEE